MAERHALEDEELKQQHALEWELKLAKEKIAKLEMEKQHQEDIEKIDDKQHELKAGLAMEDERFAAMHRQVVHPTYSYGHSSEYAHKPVATTHEVLQKDIYLEPESTYQVHHQP